MKSYHKVKDRVRKNIRTFFGNFEKKIYLSMNVKKGLQNLLKINLIILCINEKTIIVLSVQNIKISKNLKHQTFLITLFCFLFHVLHSVKNYSIYKEDSIEIL